MNRKLSSFVAALAVITVSPGAGAVAAPSSNSSQGDVLISGAKFKEVLPEDYTASDKLKIRQNIQARKSGVIGLGLNDPDVRVWKYSDKVRSIVAVLPKNERVGVYVEFQTAADARSRQSSFIRRGMTFEQQNNSKKDSSLATRSEGSGGTKVREKCRTIWFDVPGLSQDDQIYDCYEKFKISASSYVYNRYSKATIAKGRKGIRRDLHEFTIRFRESKKSNQQRITAGPYSYGPLPGSAACSSGTVAIGPVTIDLEDCGDISNLAGGRRYQTGTRFSGHEFKQQYVDSYARYSTNGREPVFSDYVWTTVASCGYIPFVACHTSRNDVDNKWNDSLW